MDNLVTQISIALEKKDYKTVDRLLSELEKTKPQSPWLPLYKAQYYEATNQLDIAEKFYRHILQNTTNQKIIPQARQGLQRLEILEKNRIQLALASNLAEPGKNEPGILIIEPVNPDHKQLAAQNMARIFSIDAYTARTQLQSRGWRLYKTGPIGQLEVYQNEMKQANIPAFCVKLLDVQNLTVFRVQYFSSLSTPTVICVNADGQMGKIQFNWSDITQRVEGLLPIFSEVMDYDPRRKDKFRHKEMTLDYAQVYDLHLLNRRTILRFCEHSYQFQEGVKFPDLKVNPVKSKETKKGEKTPNKNLNTARLNWNNMIGVFETNLEKIHLWSEFTPFAETTLDYYQMLDKIPSYIDLERKEPTLWDPAFQLYSGLVFWRAFEDRELAI